MVITLHDLGDAGCSRWAWILIYVCGEHPKAHPRFDKAKNVPAKAQIHSTFASAPRGTWHVLPAQG